MTIRHIAGAAAPPMGAYDADIAILALDRADETVAAIHSALAQTGVSRHVIVVDQGSRPETLARLAATIDGRTGATLVASDHNLGVAGGRNLAARIGHGRTIVALDNDAEFDGFDTVAQMCRVLVADAGLAAVGCRIVLDSTGGDDPTSWGYPAALRPLAGGAFDAATFVGAGHAIRRAAWDDAGGYDDRLFFCWEEYDFCLRAIARGWRVRYRGDIAVRHKVSPQRRIAWSGARWFHFVRNRIYIERKWGASWLALTPRVLGYLVKGARNGCWLDTPRAVWAAVRLSRGVAAAEMPDSGLAYLWQTDAAHRGGVLARIRREVFAALPGNRRERGSASGRLGL